MNIKEIMRMLPVDQRNTTMKAYLGNRLTFMPGYQVNLYNKMVQGDHMNSNDRRLLKESISTEVGYYNQHIQPVVARYRFAKNNGNRGRMNQALVTLQALLNLANQTGLRGKPGQFQGLNDARRLLTLRSRKAR